MRVEQCRVCGERRWASVMSFGKTPLANRFVRPGDGEEPLFELAIQRCENCGLVSLTEVVDPKVLYKNYIYISSDSHTISSHLAHLADHFCQRFSLTSRDVAGEIGSNTGTFLKLFWNRGIPVIGVDPAENIAMVANANGVRTEARFYNGETARFLKETYGPLKILIARHVLAHIDDLDNALKGVHDHLRPDGVLVVEVPYLLDLIAQTQFDTIYHEHLSYFSVATLEKLFALKGLELFDVERYPIHGGSIVVYAQRQGGPHRQAPSVQALLDLERREGLDKPEAYRRFAGRVEGVRDHLVEMVRLVKQEGKIIAGYGAPAKATTLLHYCGLGNREIDFMIDNTPAKQGMLMPGNHIPIRSDRLSAGPPDYFLLFAWNYAKEIVDKEAAFVRGGGRFIIPIPQPRVVGRVESGKFSEGPIQGVAAKPLTVYRDPRGELYEAYREDELVEGHRPAMGYISWTNPGVVRGPHEHLDQADYFVFAGPSDFRVVCWDNRPGSSTYGKRWEFTAGESQPATLLVPAGIVHAYENIGKKAGLVLNFPDRLYGGRQRKEAVDEIRYETIKDAPFVMSKSGKKTKKRRK